MRETFLHQAFRNKNETTNERGVERCFKMFKVLRYQSGSFAVTPAKGAPTLPLVERGCPKVPQQRDLREELKDCMKAPIKQGGNMDLKIAKKIHNKANYDY